MAYLRYGQKLAFVEGTSNNYVYYSTGDFMQDYGGKLSNEEVADMICQVIVNNPEYDNIEKMYFMEKLCENMNVKLKDGVKVALKI